MKNELDGLLIGDQLHIAHKLIFRIENHAALLKAVLRKIVAAHSAGALTKRELKKYEYIVSYWNDFCANEGDYLKPNEAGWDLLDD